MMGEDAFLMQTRIYEYYYRFRVRYAGMDYRDVCGELRDLVKAIYKMDVDMYR